MGRKHCCLRNWAAVGLKGCQRAILPDSSAWGRPELAAAACCMQLQRQFAGPEGAHCLFQELLSLPAKVASQHTARCSLQRKLCQLKSNLYGPTPGPLSLSLCFLGPRHCRKMHGALVAFVQLQDLGIAAVQCSTKSSHTASQYTSMQRKGHRQTHHTGHAMQAVYALDVPAAQPHRPPAQEAPETSPGAHCKQSNNSDNGDASMKAPTAAESAGPMAGQAHPDKATWSIERPAGLQEVVRWCRAQQMWPLLQGQLQASHCFSPVLGLPGKKSRDGHRQRTCAEVAMFV